MANSDSVILPVPRSLHFYASCFSASSVVFRVVFFFNRFALETRRSMLAAYYRDFESLHVKSLALFSESWTAHKRDANKEAAKREQRKICSKLHEELEVILITDLFIRCTLAAAPAFSFE